jgi:hypothetical protein
MQMAGVQALVGALQSRRLRSGQLINLGKDAASLEIQARMKAQCAELRSHIFGF